MTNAPTQPDIDVDIDTDDEQPDDEQPTEETTQHAPMTESNASSSGTGRSTTSETELDANVRAIKRYLTWGALLGCSLLAVVALIQFYGSVGDAIDLWVEPKYQPLMQAAFNLVVLLGSLIGVSMLLRELS